MPRSEAFDRVYRAAVRCVVVATIEGQRGGMTIGEHDEVRRILDFLDDWCRRNEGVAE